MLLSFSCFRHFALREEGMEQRASRSRSTIKPRTELLQMKFARRSLNLCAIWGSTTYRNIEAKQGRIGLPKCTFRLSCRYWSFSAPGKNKSKRGGWVYEDWRGVCVGISVPLKCFCFRRNRESKHPTKFVHDFWRRIEVDLVVAQLS